MYIALAFGILSLAQAGLALEGGPRGIYTKVPQDNSLTKKSLETNGYPEGYYAFNVAPNRVPPKVRKPPYQKSGRPCPGVFGVPNPGGLENLCGNLNTGFLPPNPMGHTFPDGVPYPFELIKNKTLDFFSKALPILKEDDTLPKVDMYGQFSANPELQYQIVRKKRSSAQLSSEVEQPIKDDSKSGHRTNIRATDSGKLKEGEAQTAEVEEETKPSVIDGTSQEKPSVVEVAESAGQSKESREQGATSGEQRGKGSHRQAKALCDSDDNFLCKVYNTVRGDKSSKKADRGRRRESYRERMDDDDFPSRERGRRPAPNSVLGPTEGPVTPCPTTVEYVTPIFARNYQGVWRYIVQIPYEGYFTQTVEVTKCMNRKCSLLEGSCLAAPRWVSLLVSEMFYPEVEHGASVPQAQYAEPGASDQVYQPQETQYVFQQAQPQQPQPAYNPLRNQYGRDFHASWAAEGSQEPQPVYASPEVGSRGRRKRDTGSDSYCDGYDERGCYQVRMYYDWFLVSGSCKCWRQSLSDYLGSKR